MNSRSRTIAIVGAGFSGTALAYRLLRSAHATPMHIVLIERANRFGCGLAYSERAAGTTVNVPAARMSIDEALPDDLLDFARARGLPVAAEEFIPRTLYGDYLEARLAQASREAPAQVQLTRRHGIVIGLSRTAGDTSWRIDLDDGGAVLADAVVLATGHCPPRPPGGFESLAGTGLYENDPWQVSASARPARVLLIGTGLTMADVACRLARSAHPPREIVAISRRGLLPRNRHETSRRTVPSALGFERVEGTVTLRGMVREVRQLMRRAAAAGIDWRDAMVELRARAPALWRRLGMADKARFVRHVQPYWDVHRHQLPPLVAKTLDELVERKRLRVRAGRICGIHLAKGRVDVSFQPRHQSGTEQQSFDRIINCSGPEGDPRRAESRLMRMLFASGRLSACATGTGLRVDPASRPLDRGGVPSPGLYYIGPWLRARDFEATAVHELRVQATELARRLLRAPERPAPGLLRRLLGWRAAPVDAPARRSTRTTSREVTVK
jgi:uncharacterized NAD(P)/FAD-binding protein YdhS